MKNLSDIRARARLEVAHAQNMYTKDGQERYLWFHPTVPGRDGGIMAAVDIPGPGFQIVTPEPIRMGLTAEQYVNLLTIRNILQRLPVLSV